MSNTAYTSGQLVSRERNSNRNRCRVGLLPSCAEQTGYLSEELSVGGEGIWLFSLQPAGDNHQRREKQLAGSRTSTNKQRMNELRLKKKNNQRWLAQSSEAVEQRLLEEWHHATQACFKIELD